MQKKLPGRELRVVGEREDHDMFLLVQSKQKTVIFYLKSWFSEGKVYGYFKDSKCKISL